MSQTILLRRGLEANRLNFTPAAGELIWSSDGQRLWMGDGVTAGGISITAVIEANYIQNAEKAVANGVATLGADGKVPDSQLPAVKLNNVYIVNTLTEMYELTTTGEASTDGVIEGDTVIVDGIAKNYIAKVPIPAGTLGTAADYHQLAQADSGVTSVNGDAGPSVTLTTNNIGEHANNLYYTDARATSAANAAIAAHIDDNQTSSGLLWSSDKINTMINGIVTASVQSVNSQNPDASGNVSLTTSNILEGVNQYYTDSKVQTVIANSNLDYLSNVGSASAGQYLKFDGVNWSGGSVNGSNVKIDNYTIATTTGALVPNDTINQALGKLEKGLEGAVAGAGEVNVQSDWNETNTGSDAYILNKPTLTSSFISLTDTPNNYGTSGFVITTTASGLTYSDPAVIGRTVLSALDDTSINSPSENQVLTWDSGSSRWVNQTPKTSIVDMDDTPLNIGTAGQLLAVKSDLSGFEYIDKSAIGYDTLAGLVDTTITSVALNDQLIWDGSAWINQAPAAIPDILEDLADVTVTSPIAGQVLTTDGSGNWSNQAYQ